MKTCVDVINVKCKKCKILLSCFKITNSLATAALTSGGWWSSCVTVISPL